MTNLWRHDPNRSEDDVITFRKMMCLHKPNKDRTKCLICGATAEQAKRIAEMKEMTHFNSISLDDDE